MKQLLTDIIQSISTNPSAVIIDEVADDKGTTYTITVDPSDMGRVIGKSGKVIKSIRNIAHVAAIRQETHYRINVAEVEDKSEPKSSDEPFDDESDISESSGVELLTQDEAYEAVEDQSEEVVESTPKQSIETEEEVVLMDNSELEPEQDIIADALDTTSSEK